MNRNGMSSLVLAATAAALIATGLRASEMDDRIESAFKSSYVYKTYLADDSVKVEAKDGVVTLTGTVAEESHKDLAKETAAGLPGVVRVDSQLQTKTEAATASSDTWISRKIKLALLFHRNVSASKTMIAVKDGVVTLKGEASSMAQKDLTSEYAKDVSGVKEVKNEMKVVATPESTTSPVAEKIDDASITAQIKAALLYHRSTSALKTHVATTNGDVTLTGNARSTTEKDLVTKLVSDIHGVNNVDNEMMISTNKTE